MTAEAERKRDDWNAPVTLPEPEDGTRWAVATSDGEWKVIWRDDAASRAFTDHEDERWFDSRWAPDGDPMTWQEQLRYARAVYLLAEESRVEVSRG